MNEKKALDINCLEGGRKDAETYPGRFDQIPEDAFEQTADPWKRAKVVTVAAGRENSGVELELPKSH